MTDHFYPGEKVIDLHGGLGVGVVLFLYVNFHDDPAGETLAVCRFAADGPDDAAVTCDRLLDQIAREPVPSAAPAAP